MRNGFGGVPSTGLMAEGFPGGPGQPQYAPDPRNARRLNMTGFGQQMPPMGRGGVAFPGQVPPVFLGQPMNSMPMMNSMGPMSKAFGEGPPPVGGPATPPGVPGGPPGVPGGPPSGPSTPPGVPGSPSTPPGPNGLPPWRLGDPVPNAPMQPGQYSWGWTPQGGTPSFGAQEKLYINHMLGSNPSLYGQIDNNNLLASIGQLSGVQFDPNSPLWKV